MSRRAGILVAVYVAVLAINLDVTIVNVALPSIATELGHDRAGDLVDFTGAQCGGPGAAVAAAGADATVGTVVAANGNLCYAVTLTSMSAPTRQPR